MSASPITTRVAHAGYDQHGFMGRDLYAELLGRSSLTDLVFQAITGRAPSPAERELIDILACSVTIADPRIWPLKCLRLVGAYGGFFTAIAAGNLCLEQARLGPHPFREAAETLLDVEQHLAGRPPAVDQETRAALLSTLRRRGMKAGFGVAFRPKDERVAVVRPHVLRLGRHELRYWRLFEVVAEVARRTVGLEANMALAGSAILLDMGFAPELTVPLFAALAAPSMLSNAVEARTPEPRLQRLPPSSIRYAGVPPRHSAAFKSANTDR